MSPFDRPMASNSDSGVSVSGDGGCENASEVIFGG